MGVTVSKVELVDWRTRKNLERLLPRKRNRRSSAEPQPKVYPLESDEVSVPVLSDHRCRKRQAKLLRNYYLVRKLRIRQFFNSKKTRQTE